MKSRSLSGISLGAMTLLGFWHTPTVAQTAAPAASADPEGEILVTARRRDETLQNVPVTVTAITAATLEKRGITNLEGIARITPQLFIAASTSSFQGGAIALRGIGAGDGNVFSDQAVAFNIDGVQIARALPRQLSEFDLQQVEVLKGPQALYYGKNSPGGIVVLRTADPGDHFEAGAKAYYEFNAQEIRGEAFISTPLTDSLGLRVAATGAKQRGWIHNIASPGTLYSPDHDHLPKSDEFGGRVTLKFDDGGPFKARFKFNYGSVNTDGMFSILQRVYCPFGAPQGSSEEDCRPDDRAVHAEIGPRFGTGGANTVTGAAIPGIYVYGDGEPYYHARQYLSGLQLSYDLGDHLSLASNSGFYRGTVKALDSLLGEPSRPFNPAFGPAGAGGIIAGYADYRIREISQELRLTSSFEGPLNFMVGGYYQDQKLSYVSATGINALNPIQFFPPLTLKQDGTAYSAFGSASFKPTETIELSAGARYSHENKTISYFRLLPGTLPGGAAFLPGQEVPSARPKRSFHNVSPEGTIAWRPNADTTVYASWKRGFISGGFNGTPLGTGVPVVRDQSYEQEVVEGFEGGLKLRALEDAVQINLAAYSYKIKGLQVTSAFAGPPAVQTINNAAGARSKGVEASVNWTKTPVSGLSMNGAISYSDAKYSNFRTSPCYGGQTIAQGCNLSSNGTFFTNQDLSGQRLVRAPRWAGAVGANYNLKRENRDELNLAVDGNYTSSFFTDGLNAPGGIQRGYWLLDASAGYQFHNGVGLALIGRNLTNKYYFQRSGNVQFTGSQSGLATGIAPDQGAAVSRGRELRVQASIRF